MNIVVRPDTTVAIPAPPPDEEQVWRYMELSKFEAMVKSRALFFPRVAILEDEFEGAFPEPQSVLARALSMIGLTEMPPGMVVHPSPELERAWSLMRKWAEVSCWHVSDHESDAMWRLYARTGRSIAVQSTVGRLREALGTPAPVADGFFGSDKFEFGNVEYIDYTTGHIPPMNMYAQFFRKRHAFEHEKEMRVFIARLPLYLGGTIREDVEPPDNGTAFPVALDTLIQRVLIAPKASEVFLETVRAMAESVAPNARVQRSSLEARPTY